MKEKLITLNPQSEKTIKKYSAYSKDKISSSLASGSKSFEAWKNISVSERLKPLLKLAKLLRSNSQKYAKLITVEMGKPITQALSEIEKCAKGCEFYAKNSIKYLKPERVQTGAHKSYICFEPLGLIFGIMPWNFPFWQVFRFAIPALMSGNGVLLKHSPNVMGCANEIEKLFLKAGFPKYLFQNLPILKSQVEEIILSPLVQGLSLTGSVKAGRSVAALAGKYLKKIVLELGGSDPFIVLKDADLNLTLQEAMIGRFSNGGQSCIAAKRFILLKPIAEKFIAEFLSEIKKLKTGNPFDTSTHLGPMAREDLRLNLHKQVCESIKKGSQLLWGGILPKGKGFFYPPTLVQVNSRNVPLWNEEVFGPVAVFHIVNSEAEAIQIANDSDFGLGASVYTRDLKRGENFARQLEAGNCFVNQVVHSDPRLPFGGIKNSGLGRELSQYGMREFVNIKTVHIQASKKAS